MRKEVILLIKWKMECDALFGDDFAYRLKYGVDATHFGETEIPSCGRRSAGK